MSGRWWRAYSRARHDPKLLKLSDKNFRWWFNLICVAADNGGVLPSHADLAVEFRTSGAVMTQILDSLIAAGMLDHDETGIRPHNWNGLQYVSDSSSNRVKQFRERQRNVSETPSESEAETETDTEANASAADAARKAVWQCMPWLMKQTGKSRNQLGGMVGAWCKDYGETAVLAAFQQAQRESPAEPIGWITAKFKPREEGMPEWRIRQLREAEETIARLPQ